MVFVGLVHFGCRLVNHLLPVNHFDHGLHLGQILKQRQAHLYQSLVLFQPELHPLLEERNVAQHLGPVFLIPT